MAVLDFRLFCPCHIREGAKSYIFGGIRIHPSFKEVFLCFSAGASWSFRPTLRVVVTCWWAGSAGSAVGRSCRPLRLGLGFRV